ncbi:hypothetical protein ZHAS_00011260 [Anopheles sinensis]|uniref:Uncharacterized protein n=1 Tax=Anopheles sinensis TaxID=74873 RepID=A0A084VZR5_ANOSI|nr:hypothetical protein ZHAS_00011260 [Anopheles sinensis]
MVTIRNDIESNGTTNKSPDLNTTVATSGVAGVKNLNHLANGSRRSTLMDMKSKTFNRQCVGFLALIVCVGISFGVGMSFLYGHLVDRLNESGNGTNYVDKNGNSVVPVTSTESIEAVTTVKAPSSSISTTSETQSTSTVTVPPTTSSSSTTGPTDHSAERKSSEDFDIDMISKIFMVASTSSKPELPEVTSDRVHGSIDDEDDSEGSGHNSGYGSDDDYANDRPYDGSGRRN